MHNLHGVIWREDSNDGIAKQNKTGIRLAIVLWACCAANIGRDVGAAWMYGPESGHATLKLVPAAVAELLHIWIYAQSAKCKREKRVRCKQIECCSAASKLTADIRLKSYRSLKPVNTIIKKFAGLCSPLTSTCMHTGANMGHEAVWNSHPKGYDQGTRPW